MGIDRQESVGINRQESEGSEVVKPCLAPGQASRPSVGSDSRPVPSRHAVSCDIVFYSEHKSTPVVTLTCFCSRVKKSRPTRKIALCERIFLEVLPLFMV